MKETIQLNDKEYKFKGYRIPEGYHLPAVYKTGPYELDPEALFETEDGDLIGLHPLSKILRED